MTTVYLEIVTQPNELDDIENCKKIENTVKSILSIYENSKLKHFKIFDDRRGVSYLIELENKKPIEKTKTAWATLTRDAYHALKIKN